MNFEQAVEINAPPEIVWPVMVDVERWSQWTASITEVVRLDSGPIAVGSRARIRQPRLPKAIWTVTQFVPNSGFVWESKSVGVYIAGEHWITPDGNGRSKVLLRLRQNGFLAAILSPLTAGLIRKYMNMEALGLKKQCESLTAAARPGLPPESDTTPPAKAP
jgi:hypothetical protein